MRRPNPEKYAAAQDRIREGLWMVDPEAGLVYGSNGTPFQTPCRGYVQFHLRLAGRSRFLMAHRVIWEYVHGPITDVLTINHLNGVKNDNRLVNLEVVTQQENNLHALMTGLVQMGEESSNARLTESQVLEIYRRAWAGEHQPTLGEEFGVTREAVSNIKQGHAWAYVTGHANRRHRYTA